MTCSARSFGCATSSAVSRAILVGVAAAGTRSGDRPRRDVPALDSAAAVRETTTGRHAAEAARRPRMARGLPPQRRIHATPDRCHRAALSAPGTREVGLVDVAGGDVFLGAAYALAGIFRALPPPSDRRADWQRPRTADCRAADFEIAQTRRAWLAASPSSRNREHAVRSRDRSTARCARRSANAEIRRAAPRGSLQYRLDFLRQFVGQDRRTSRPRTAAVARVARRRDSRRSQRSRLSRKPPGPIAGTRATRAPARVACQPRRAGSKASMLKRVSGPCAALSSNTG